MTKTDRRCRQELIAAEKRHLRAEALREQSQKRTLPAKGVSINDAEAGCDEAGAFAYRFLRQAGSR